MSKYNGYTTGNLLDYLYNVNYHKRIDLDLSKQTNTSIPEQTNFTGKLQKYDVALLLFIGKQQQETILNFSLDLLIVTEQYKQCIKNIRLIE